MNGEPSRARRASVSRWPRATASDPERGPTWDRLGTDLGPIRELGNQLPTKPSVAFPIRIICDSRGLTMVYNDELC
ncbi:MAG: hypothetical protein CBB71_13030 [Rhodopirellula sp. TMED11]|nr:MAG: hypothetical protein CBB71_13030 [Rhodopirellula sp. TMED11]